MSEEQKSGSTVSVESPGQRKPSPAERHWEEKTLQPTLAKSPERAAELDRKSVV